MPFVISALALSGVACGPIACDDSYAPNDPGSCSYSPELVALEKELDANVGQAFPIQTEGEGQVYLAVSPRVVARNVLPRMTIVNSSDLGVSYGPAHSLVESGRPVAHGCDRRRTVDVLEPGEESAPLKVGPCKPRPLKPGFYGVDTSVVFVDGNSKERVTVGSYFEVHNRPAKPEVFR